MMQVYRFSACSVAFAAKKYKKKKREDKKLKLDNREMKRL